MIRSRHFVLAVSCFLLSLSSTVLGQHYYQSNVIQSHPSYTYPTHHPQVIYHPPATSIPAPFVQTAPWQPPAMVDPVAACCDCGVTSGDCDCKALGDCTLKLFPPNCRITGKTIKTPIPYQPFGKIPKLDIPERNCYKLIREFDHPTKVPTIECTTEICTEIGTRTIRCEADGCKPGCSFRVCVPINECRTKTVECKLVDQVMPHKIYLRERDPLRGNTYDVYIINNSDSAAPNYAGGMPAKWLVMHCATKSQVQARFPGMVASLNGKDVKPQSTEADVAVEFVVNKEMMKELLEFESSESAARFEGEPSDQREPKENRIDNADTDVVADFDKLAEDALSAIENAIAKNASVTSNE